MISKSLFCLLFGTMMLSVFAFSQFSFADLSFSDEFGDQGTSDDEFDEPTDLAISNDGKKLYVVDSENNRIKIYDLTGGNNCPSGTDEIINDEVCFDDDFGSSGSSDGRFDIPTGLAIDKGNGDIYVVDSDNNRVQRFQSNGDFDNLEFGSSSSGDDEYLGTPSAIAVHKKTDYIYVADSTADSISVFDDDGDFLFSFDDDDSNDRFDKPAGLVIDDSEDILYVADTGNNRIRMFELTDDDNCPSGTDEVVNDEVCFVDDFGSFGNDEGEFDEPSGLTFDEDENMLYVADTENNRIQVFEIIAGNTCPSGTDEIIDGVCFVEEFGTSGSTDGKFNAPSGLAIDEDNGLLYVADTDNNRIQMLSSTGSSSDTISFSDKFGSVGDDNDEFDKPTGLAIDNSDQLYIVDSENNRIKIYDLTGGNNCPSGTDEIINDEVCFDDDFGSSGSSDGRFDIPTGLAIDKGNGDIYVVDSDNNRVQRFQSNGDFDNLEFGSSSSGDDEYLGTPSAIAVHKKTDYIYVADSTADSISVFDDDGDFLFSFDDDDSNDRFDKPAGLVIDDSEDILYVADTGNNRIRMFELTDDDNCPSGTDEVVNDEVCFVDDFGSFGNDEGEFDEPSGLTFDEDENMLYVADTENNRIQVFEIIAGNTCPSGTDEIIDGVCFVEEFGTSGSTDGKFNAPSGLAIDEDNGLLYVADTDNNRIQMFTVPTGDGGSSSSSSSSSNGVPDSPKKLSASAASPSSIVITWDTPDPEDNDPKITGYEIEAKEGSGSYETIVTDTKSTATSFLHTGLDDGETYRYRVYAINSEGTSGVSSTASAKPGPTNTPGGLTAVPISKNQVLLSWLPPSETFNQPITGYIIEREIISDVLYEDISRVSGSTTTYTVNGLATGKTYSFVVSAEFSVGNTPRSDAVSATPELDSKPTSTSSSSSSVTAPTTPRNLKTNESSSQIQLSWNEPSSDGNSKITGYKIEVKKNSDSYSTLKSNTNTSATSYVDSNVQTGSTYTYRIYAINSVGTSSPSEISATPQDTTLQLSPLGKFTIDEKKTLSFTVKVTDSSLNNVTFSLEKSPPAGAKINSNTGLFTWIPTNSQGAKSYVFDIVAKKDSMIDRQSVTITVNDIKTSEPTKEPEPNTTTTEPKELGVASFVDETKDPQSYVDRYNNEATYKEWFDDNFAEYDSIYQAVGLEKPLLIPASFVDETKDPQSYVDRYNNEATYKEWFDDNFTEYDSIYQAVGLVEPKVEEKKFGICGPGTKLIDGVCTIVEMPVVKPWWQFW